MPIIGNSSQPGPTHEGFGLNSQNQHAQLVTLPGGGPWRIYRVGVWAAGYGATPTAYNCVWDTGGNLLTYGSPYTMANPGGFADYQYETDVTPIVLAGGTSIYVGFSRAASGGAQFGSFSSGGAHYDDSAKSSIPTYLSGGNHGNTAAFYAYYDLANQAPTATPVLADWTRVATTTPTLTAQYTDPDGHNSASYHVQVDNNRNFAGGVADIWDSGEVAWVAASGATASVVTPALPAGSWLGWRFRFKDSQGAWSAWSAVRSIHVDLAPYAPTPTSPVHTSRIASNTPTLQATYSDPEGDPCDQIQVQMSSNDTFTAVYYDQIVAASVASGGTISHTVPAQTRGTYRWWRMRARDNMGLWGPWSTNNNWVYIASLPTVPSLTPAANGLAFITNLAETQAWDNVATWAKARFAWTYSHPDGPQYAQTAYNVQWSHSGPGAIYHDDGVRVSAALFHDEQYAEFINGQTYWWRVQVRDDLGQWSGWTAWTAFKVRWGQAIYEANPGAGSGSWQFNAASMPTNTYSAFLYRSATGPGGAGASAWYSSIGSVPVKAYLQVLVRLSTKVSGTNPSLTDMTFTYLGSPTTPDRWTTVGGSDWSLDNDLRRFGTQSFRCLVSAVADREAYPFRKVTGDDVPVQPNTWYTFSAHVKTLGDLGTARLKLRVEGGGGVGVIADGAGDEVAETADSSAHPDGWQRLRLVFQTRTGDSLIRPKIVYAANGQAAGKTFWVDAFKLEEGTVATAWTPGFVGNAIVLDSNGIQIDAAAGGLFRVRGSSGGVRDTVEVGPTGLLFGSDLEVSSPRANVVRLGNLYTGAGTSFPSSPVTGERFWRTDLGFEYFWDGTRWLTTIEFSESSQGQRALNPFTSTAYLNMPLRSGAIYLTGADYAFYHTVAQSGSVFWYVALHKTASDGTTATLIADLSTGGHTSASRFYKVNQTIANLVAASDVMLQWTIQPSGAAGSVYFTARLRYRLVG